MTASYNTQILRRILEVPSPVKSSSSALLPIESTSSMRASEDMVYLQQEYDHLMEVGQVPTMYIYLYMERESDSC